MKTLRVSAAVLLAATLIGCSPAAVESLLSTPTPSIAATASPTSPPPPTATVATATPTTAPTVAPTATTPTATTSPAGATPTMSAAEAWAALYAWSCTRVRHTSLGDFVSYLEWGIGLHDFFGQDPRDLVDYIEITVIGANDDEPEVLEYDAELGFWLGLFGLRSAGAKTIVNVRVHWQDGSVTDATERFIEDLGTDTFDVRFPQEDEFGDCDDMPPVSPT